MRKPRKYGKSDFYHVAQRTVGQQPMFHSEEDKEYFISLLEKLSPQYGKISSFAIMENHFHLQLQMRDVSKFMQRLNTSYAVYYNRKYDRKGPLFQGRFFSEPIDEDKYLLNCLQYILNNPVQIGHKLFDSRFSITSIGAYFRGEYSFVDTALVTDHFQTEKDLIEFLKEHTENVDFYDSEKVKRISDASLIRYTKILCGRLDFAQASYKIKLKIARKLRDRTPCSIKQLSRIFDISYGFLLRELRKRVQKIIFTFADMFPDAAYGY